MSRAEQPPADESYYQAHQKVYPREVKGRFTTLRTTAVWVLLGLFYGLPWLRWDDRQAILFDLPARKFHLLGLTLWPQDFIFLAWLLVIAALSLFFFTAVGGRLWCGYACPQTVWTEVFIWMERLTEGDRAKRMKLDAAPWSGNKLLRKAAKQTLWIVFSLWTGFTFVGFFTPIDVLAEKVLTLSLGSWETFWVLFYGFATYGNAGFLREQAEPDFIDDLEEPGAVEGGLGLDEEQDDLYDDAVQIVIQSGKASTSMVQRHLKIGYNRAARIIDMMEANGVVGPADGSRPREVLVGGA